MSLHHGFNAFSVSGLTGGSEYEAFENWAPVEEKFRKKLNGWAAKTLSIGGRLTLIKSVLNNIPLYFFSLFKALKSIISKLEILRNKFFWGEVGQTRKIIWASNKRLYADYDNAGLKIGSLAAKNLALLAKWWWRFQTEKDKLWAPLISSIYGESARLGSSPSAGLRGIWSDIIHVGKLIEDTGIGFANHFK